MQLYLIRIHGQWKEKGEWLIFLRITTSGSNYTFGVRLNLKAAKNRNTLIEQLATLIEHPS